MAKKKRKAKTAGSKAEEKERREERTRNRRTRVIVLWSVAGAVLAAAIALMLYLNTRGLPGRLMPDEGRDHAAEGMPLKYKRYPPTSGIHFPSAMKWGVYSQEVKEGHFVHNLEHGGIAILYNCPSACPDLVQKLEEAYRTFPKAKYGEVKMVIAPYHNMQHRIALLAWDYLDEMDTFDRDRALNFYQTHVDRGPEDVP